ncbi:uncharacterized protein LOC121306990 isoform X4 [Polyodon spathula]|uniref:uncharacterized protein LOC121306990 isoform X4 n=1 Tax=Polyodon spathula TaxID=7913 RepID=UPI001B7F2C02|nr:uncharacterized protein LOC121306990 isoform X4 [Polyodon spathula]
MKGFVDRLTLGITRILESRPGVTVVKFVQKEPAERHVILSWELSWWRSNVRCGFWTVHCTGTSSLSLPLPTVGSWSPTWGCLSDNADSPSMGPAHRPSGRVCTSPSLPAVTPTLTKGSPCLTSCIPTEPSRAKPSCPPPKRRLPASPQGLREEGTWGPALPGNEPSYPLKNCQKVTPAAELWSALHPALPK